MTTEFTDYLKREALAMLLGKEIGRGVSRVVHAYDPDPDNFVVKLEDNACSFHNAMEWEIWSAVKDIPSKAKWFAPCVRISPCGGVLVQRRTTLLGAMPKKMPRWFTDFKPDNYGRLDGRVVCHDYAMHHMFLYGTDVGSKNVVWV